MRGGAGVQAYTSEDAKMKMDWGQKKKQDLIKDGLLGMKGSEPSKLELPVVWAKQSSVPRDREAQGRMSDVKGKVCNV